MATRDDVSLTQDQLTRLAKKGSMVQAWIVRSMAQELLRRRQWDASLPTFIVSPGEQKLLEGLRGAVGNGERDAICPIISKSL